MSTNVNSTEAAAPKSESGKDANDNCLPGKSTPAESTGAAEAGAVAADEYIRSYESLLGMERLTWIVAHRKMLQEGAMFFGVPQLKPNAKFLTCLTVAAPEIKSKPVKKVDSLKPIYIKDIKKTMENKAHHNFKGGIIKFMSIDDASVGQQSTRLVAEDADKATYRVIIYDYPYDSKPPDQPSPDNVKILQRNLGFGSVFSVMNPYAKKAAFDGEPYIRIEDSSTLIYHPEESMVNRCRYCYKPEVEQRCALCHRHYCSRICQKKDWKINQHKLTCGIKFREL